MLNHSSCRSRSCTNLNAREYPDSMGWRWRLRIIRSLPKRGETRRCRAASRWPWRSSTNATTRSRTAIGCGLPVAISLYIKGIHRCDYLRAMKRKNSDTLRRRHDIRYPTLKHHYAPQFFPAQWAVNDGKLCVYSAQLPVGSLSSSYL